MQRFALPQQYAAPRIETTESEGEPHYRTRDQCHSMASLHADTCRDHKPLSALTFASSPLQRGSRRERRTICLVSHVLDLPHDRSLAAEPVGPGSTPVAVPSCLPRVTGRQWAAIHPGHSRRRPASSRSARSLQRLALYAVRSFPSSYRPFRGGLCLPLRSTALSRCPKPFLALPRSGALASIRCCSCRLDIPGAAGDDALCAWPTHGCLTHGLVWWSDRFSRLCLPMPGTAACFFDWRTLPARRGASKRSRLDDHGPLQDPRDRPSSRVQRF